MDVVYNHVSNYDLNPFKFIDKKYYFRLDENGEFITGSGCGNDFKTERPMARRLIVESLLYWMREYHIDGFRFDLATLIDGKTLDVITLETRRLNPDVILIAEPWGGGKYGQEEFSRRGWAAWNDMFRNGVKGQNPRDGQGFIFGKWQGGNSPESLRHYIAGTLRTGGGPFYRAAHSVNYLESHDDETLGDFIRIGTGEVKEDQVVADVDVNAALPPNRTTAPRPHPTSSMGSVPRRRQPGTRGRQAQRSPARRSRRKGVTLRWRVAARITGSALQRPGRASDVSGRRRSAPTLTGSRPAAIVRTAQRPSVQTGGKS